MGNCISWTLSLNLITVVATTEGPFYRQEKMK